MYKALQGNLGLGKAIEYFTSIGISVALPLNDTQKYDLIIDFNNKLQRVSVKTSTFSENNGKSYVVQLKNTGGSSGKSKIRPFDNTSCDYIFIYTADENLYFIPSNKVDAINSISVGIKWTEYKVRINTLSEFMESMSAATDTLP